MGLLSDSSFIDLPIRGSNLHGTARMAHIENRSRTQVTVKNRSDLTRLFPHNKLEAAQRYISELRSAGFRPVATVLDEAYLVCYRLHGKRCNFTARTEKEALATHPAQCGGLVGALHRRGSATPKGLPDHGVPDQHVARRCRPAQAKRRVSSWASIPGTGIRSNKVVWLRKLMLIFSMVPP